MVDSFTANLGILIADLNDTVDFAAQVEAGITTLDTFMGAVKCTSSTRPSNTYGGQLVYETDTTLWATNTNTKASPTWTYLGTTSVLNVRSKGAKGDGSTDDTTAMQNAVNTANTLGIGAVYFPPGTYMAKPGATTAALTLNNGTTGYNVRLIGHNPIDTVIKKSANGVLLAMAGPASDLTGGSPTHCKYSSLENIGLNGGTFTGTMVQCYYADNLSFTNVRFKDNYDVVIDTAEFWDSRFYNCVFETSGSVTTPSATMPNVWLRNSANGTLGQFGYSTDNVNQIHFVGCRWEDFRNGAVRIEQGPAALNNVNGIYFTHCKFESSFLNGGDHFFTDLTSRAIFVVDAYAFSGGFETGFSTAQNIFNLSSAATKLQNVQISDRAATPTIASGVVINSTNANEAISLEDVHGIYNTSPTGAHVTFGTATGAFSIENVDTNSGTLYGGTLPTSFSANKPLNQVSGAISDASFVGGTPLDGTMGLDILNKRLYVRQNSGNWNFVPIKTISSAVIAATTVANTTALSTLQTATVPANDAQTASVYVVRGYGIFSTTGAPTLQFGLYWNAITGTLLAQTPAITLPTGVTNLPFEYEAIVTMRSTTTATAVLKVFIDTSGTTDAASSFVASPGTVAGSLSTAAAALAVGVTWGTASASNTISCQGGYTEKIR